MADEDSFMEEDVGTGQDVEVGQKVGFLPAAALKILKWAAICVAAVLFIVTVVWVTMKFMDRGTRSGTVPSVSAEYSTKPPILTPYDAFDDIRTRTSDETAYTVAAKVALGYEEGNKDIQAELVKRSRMLQDLIRGFFSQKTAAELDPKYEELLKDELKERINRVLRDGKIEAVWFLELNVIPL